MTTKEFFKHPATITIGIVLTLGLLAWVGKTYWGWFGGNIDSDGFPKNPKVGDSFTKGEQVYVFRAVNCVTTPCPDGSWVPQHNPLPYERASSDNSARSSSNAISMCRQMKANLDAMLKKANALQADAQTAYNHLHTFITNLPYAAFGAQESIVRCNHNKQCETAVHDYNNKITTWQNYMNLYRKEESDYITKCLGGQG